jgi:hypothetical protein
MLRSIAAWFISGNKGSRETAARRRGVFQAAGVVPILDPALHNKFSLLRVRK